MDQNLPVLTGKPDLLTRLKWATVSWEVRLDDWRKRKTNFVVTVDLSRLRMFLKSNKVTSHLSYAIKLMSQENYLT